LSFEDNPSDGMAIAIDFGIARVVVRATVAARCNKDCRYGDDLRAVDDVGKVDDRQVRRCRS